MDLTPDGDPAPVGESTSGGGAVGNDCRRVTVVLSRLGDKWTVLVIVVLRNSARRFNDIKRQIDGISQQMLSRTLKSLERDGLVTRRIFPTNPPQVEYELTSLGRSLSEPVFALGAWIHQHLDLIETSRLKFDERQADGA